MIHKKLSIVALLTTCLYAVHGTQPNTAQATTEPAPSVSVAAAPAIQQATPTIAATSTLATSTQSTPITTLAGITQAQPKAADQRNYLRMFAKFVVDVIIVLIVSFLFTFIEDSLPFWPTLIISCFVAVVAYIVTYIFGFLHGLVNKLFEPSQNATQALTGKPATATTSAPSAVPSTSTPKSNANTAAA